MRPGTLASVTWLLALGGCDVVFSVDRLPPAPSYPGQVINDPDGDLDEDGDLNGTDLCPTVPNTEVGANTDMDMDGVGDRCDPHPSKPGDCLALFDDFHNETAPSPHWRVQGSTLAIGTNDLEFPRPNPDLGDEVLVYLDQPLDLDALFVWGYVQNGDQPSSNTRSAIQIFFDMRIDTTNGLVTGDGCGVESTGVAAQVTHTSLVASDETTAAIATLGPLLVGVPNDFELSWGQKPGECSAYLTGVDGDGRSMVAAKEPPSRVFGLRGV
ncbi:MAG TPA: hypothetical protein VLB44_18635, partial [Kofleriaceae bacterium]|nr:hypothetical protein [Kofleriaceae bacterium]